MDFTSVFQHNYVMNLWSRERCLSKISTHQTQCLTWNGWMTSLTQWTWVWANREAWCAAVQRFAENQTQLSDWTTTTSNAVSFISSLLQIKPDSFQFTQIGLIKHEHAPLSYSVYSSLFLIFHLGLAKRHHSLRRILTKLWFVHLEAARQQGVQVPKNEIHLQKWTAGTSKGKTGPKG